MPNPLLDAYNETLEVRPDVYRVRRLLEEIVQLFARGTWTIPAAVNEEIMDDFHRYERFHISMTQTVTFSLGGDEYVMQSGQIYSMTTGEYLAFSSHVPSASFTVVLHEDFGASGTIRVFAKEAD